MWAKNLLQLLQREMRTSLVVPRYHGACGRTVVVQHGGLPLSDFLDAPWAKRADLALQVLSFVDTLWVRSLANLSDIIFITLMEKAIGPD